MSRLCRRSVAGSLLLAVGMPALAWAHTDSSLVAVPAGQTATVALQPTHGCGDSPTVEVAIQVPVPDAAPVPVDGWTATAAPEAGRTVLEWTGGSLPPDEQGAFPAQFVAPDTVGELLLFPSVQVCENGEELAWIAGDPKADYPAPRLLVLPPDAEAAETIDDVPLDAPGRDQLDAIVDVDNPTGTTAPPTTERDRTTTTERDRTTTTERDRTTTTESADDDGPGDDAADSDDDSNAALWLVAAVLLAIVIGLVVMRLSRRRR